jgi:hypothetical protein
MRNLDIFFSAAENRAMYWWSPDRTARGGTSRRLKRREGLALETCDIEAETGKVFLFEPGVTHWKVPIPKNKRKQIKAILFAFICVY